MVDRVSDGDPDFACVGKFFRYRWEKYGLCVGFRRKNSGAKPGPNQPEVLIQKQGGTSAFESGK